MNRRRIVATIGIAITAPLVGCLSTAESDTPGDDSEDPEMRSVTITAAEPELAAGERATLTVEATDVVGVQILPEPAPHMISFGLSDAAVSPSPTATYQMNPPAWHWDTESTVEVELPVAVANDAQPHEYGYAVRGVTNWPSTVELGDEEWTNEWETAEERFTITVTE